MYLYRAIDQHGQVIDVLLSVRRDLVAARWFFARGHDPGEVTTDRAPVYLRVLDELSPQRCTPSSVTGTTRSKPTMAAGKRGCGRCGGLKRHRSALVISAGHAFVQYIRRGHYELATDIPARHRIRSAFDELAMAI
jgi:transposase, IS6 family